LRKKKEQATTRCLASLSEANRKTISHVVADILADVFNYYVGGKPYRMLLQILLFKYYHNLLAEVILFELMTGKTLIQPREVIRWIAAAAAFRPVCWVE
jgi:hypothetical protein